MDRQRWASRNRRSARARDRPRVDTPLRRRWYRNQRANSGHSAAANGGARSPKDLDSAWPLNQQPWRRTSDARDLPRRFSPYDSNRMIIRWLAREKITPSAWRPGENQEPPRAARFDISRDLQEQGQLERRLMKGAARLGTSRAPWCL